MSRYKPIFIIGTDTDIGKTFIAGQIARESVKRGIKTGYYKAALSGAETINSEIVPGDAVYVEKNAFIDTVDKKNFAYKVSYIFEEAVSPHLASEINNVDIDLNIIKNDYKRLESKTDFTICEGSGGIVCPIYIKGDKRIFLEDIIKELSVDTVLVSGSGLGSINSTVLAVEYAQSKGINIKAIIMNRFEGNNIIHKENMKVIENMTGIPVYVCKDGRIENRFFKNEIFVD